MAIAAVRDALTVAATLAIRTIVPGVFALTIYFAASLAQKNDPYTLISKILFSSEVGYCIAGRLLVMPVPGHPVTIYPTAHCGETYPQM